jgi:hypothetical protein
MARPDLCQAVPGSECTDPLPKKIDRHAGGGGCEEIASVSPILSLQHDSVKTNPPRCVPRRSKPPRGGLREPGSPASERARPRTGAALAPSGDAPPAGSPVRYASQRHGHARDDSTGARSAARSPRGQVAAGRARLQTGRRDHGRPETRWRGCEPCYFRARMKLVLSDTRNNDGECVAVEREQGPESAEDTAASEEETAAGDDRHRGEHDRDLQEGLCVVEIRVAPHR